MGIHNTERRLAVLPSDECRILKGALSALDELHPAMQIIKRLEDTYEAYEPDMVELADEQYGRDGEIEIDPGAVCSRGEDDGCYVQAWVWVADEDLE